MPSHELSTVSDKLTARQRVKLFMANMLWLGPTFTSLGVEAEISDRQYGLKDSEPPPMELVRLIEAVKDAPTREAKYKLLTQPVPYPQGQPAPGRPELWFDYIGELTSRDINRCIAKTALGLLPPDRHMWRKAADLGAGVGALGSLLIGEGQSPRIAESLTLVDLSPSLLQVAAERYGSGMEYAVADVTNLLFSAKSLDLVTSSGLIYCLGNELQDLYFKEVSRILEPGGFYLDGDYSVGSRRIEGALSVERHQLGWLIAMMVSGEKPFNPLLGVDQEAYFKQFSLRLSNRQIVDESTDNNIQIRILEKTA